MQRTGIARIAKFHYGSGMRTLALIAFMGLQLSMFTCGIDIHVDHPDSAAGQITQLHNGTNGQETGLMDEACQIHASSHVFADQKAFILANSEAPPGRIYRLAMLNFMSVPRLIERPPRFSYSRDRV